jgi:hypothetical protein
VTVSTFPSGGSSFFKVEEMPWPDEEQAATAPREMIVLLEGSCTMLGGGPTLEAHDSMVLLSGDEYGFTAGDDGMKFLTIRTGAAGTRLA